MNVAELAPWVTASFIAVLWFFAHRTRARQRHEMRMAQAERDHRERMAALEQGIDLPPRAMTEVDPVEVQLVMARRALVLGALLFAAGAGWGLGLYLMEETPQNLGMREMYPLALVPAGVGAALLLLSRVLRRSA